MVWKGLALWRAARLKQVGWYIALIIINTLGIFEIIYLIATRKKYKETYGCVP
jgi:methionyl-tRNA synthetase